MVIPLAQHLGPFIHISLRLIHWPRLCRAMTKNAKAGVSLWFVVFRGPNAGASS